MRHLVRPEGMPVPGKVAMIGRRQSRSNALICR